MADGEKRIKKKDEILSPSKNKGSG